MIYMNLGKSKGKPEDMLVFGPYHYLNITPGAKMLVAPNGNVIAVAEKGEWHVESGDSFDLVSIVDAGDVGSPEAN
jgi:hypothetical protein